MIELEYNTPSVRFSNSLPHDLHTFIILILTIFYSNIKALGLFASRVAENRQDYISLHELNKDEEDFHWLQLDCTRETQPL